MTRALVVDLALACALLGQPRAAAPQTVAADPLSLTADTALAAPAFDPDALFAPAVLDALGRHVDAPARDAFQGALALLKADQLRPAEAAFKRLITPDGDSTAPLAGLGATYARSGQDAAAAGAWQMALTGATDIPELYAWLGAALLRLHRIGDAGRVYAEAASAWPADGRFVIGVAVTEALSGHGRQGIDRLDVYLAGGAADVQALYLAIEWIDYVHAEQMVIHGAAADLDRARAYARRYEEAHGPDVSTVRQRVRNLERTRR